MPVRNTLHDTYIGSKSARDSWRGTAMVLAMTDFNNAWEMMIGTERPSNEEVQKLAGKFQHNTTPNSNAPEVTLAWIESYTLQIEKLLHKAILGQEYKGNISLGTTLNKAWPEVSKQVEYRELQGEFSRHIEANLTNSMNKHPDTPLDKTDIKILQAAYTGADMTNTPEGAQNTLTRMAPGQTEPRKLFTDAVSLRLPCALKQANQLEHAL